MIVYTSESVSVLGVVMGTELKPFFVSTLSIMKVIFYYNLQLFIHN